MYSLSSALLLIFLAHGQTMVRKDQVTRNMIHILEPRSGIGSENATKTTTSHIQSVIEREAKRKNEPRKLAMGRGVVDDVAKEIAIISNAVAAFIQAITSPVLKTVSELVYPVLHRLAKVFVEEVYPVAYALFQVWYNSPIMRLTRKLLNISLEIIENILKNQAVQHLFNDMIFPVMEMLLERVIFPPFELLLNLVVHPLLKHVVWPVLVEVADVAWNVVVPTTQLAASLPLLVLDKALNIVHHASRQIGLPEPLIHTFTYMVYLTLGITLLNEL